MGEGAEVHHSIVGDAAIVVLASHVIPFGTSGLLCFLALTASLCFLALAAALVSRSVTVVLIDCNRGTD